MDKDLQKKLQEHTSVCGECNNSHYCDLALDIISSHSEQQP
jgi:hypothetical protein